VVGELVAVAGVSVGPGEGVRVLGGGDAIGVDATAVKEGVKIAWRVNAAAVCISEGGGNCSKGMLQARIARIRLAPARVDLRFWIIDIYSFLCTASSRDGIPPLFYHFQMFRP
jgi:hypothetical protein